MAETIRDQLLKKGVVKPEDLPEARRGAARAARPVEVDKELPPLFEAPARGFVVDPDRRPPR